MFDVLEELNKTSGITGSMLVGRDGIVIAADLQAAVEDDTLGALAASINANVQKSLSRLGQPSPEHITIEAQNTKLFIADCGVGVLVVTTEKEANLGLVRLEVRNAKAKINAPGQPGATQQG
jgi:predicted regulator of Ras-like GTPase activity (Roadblock/LC7/MglB family)